MLCSAADPRHTQPILMCEAMCACVPTVRSAGRQAGMMTCEAGDQAHDCVSWVQTGSNSWKGVRSEQRTGQGGGGALPTQQGSTNAVKCPSSSWDDGLWQVPTDCMHACLVDGSSFAAAFRAVLLTILYVIFLMDDCAPFVGGGA